jgi:hypothetical protein
MSIGAILPSSASLSPGYSVPPVQPSAPAEKTTPATTINLSPEAQAMVEKLKARDLEVRQHEQAHMAAAGGLVLSGPSYTYQRGPDGVNYAIGGEVNIDTSPGATPEETIERARTIQAAAMAPAEPSGPDRAVAAQAQQMEMKARAEQAQRAYEDPPQKRHALDIFA